MASYKVADTDTDWRYTVADTVGGNCSDCLKPFLDGVLITRESKHTDRWQRSHVCRECFSNR
jgi:hypothetical protein